MKTPHPFLLVPIATLLACATTEVPPPLAETHAEQATQPVEVASVMASGSFGSPVVSNRPATSLTPRWVPEGQHGRLRCDGPSDPLMFSGQAPYRPSSEAISRSFDAADYAVRACAPPVTPAGHLPIHGMFVGSGTPQEYTFPGVDLSESQALCVGRSLCAVRLPTFRQVSTSVDYEYRVSPTAVADD